MITQCASENAFFNIFTHANQLILVVAVVNPHDSLINNRTFVQILRDIMTGRTNQFHSSFKRLLVGVRTNKRW